MKCYYLILLFFSSKLLAPMENSKLTVAEALSLPSSENILTKIASRGETRHNPDAEKMILEHLKAILQGTYLSSSKSESTTTLAGDRLQTALIGLFSRSQLTSLKQGIVCSLKTFIPSLTTTLLMKNIAKTCSSVHQTVQQQKNILQAQERDLASSYIVSIAHAFALEALVKLVFIVYSPHTLPCERMHALYMLNSMHLLGTKEELFKRWRNRTNRFYFSQEGKLLLFDPSSVNTAIPKRIKALNNFLKILAHSHGEYLALLTAGIKAGIIQLREYLHQAAAHPWVQKKSRFLWIYAAEIFRETTSLDIVYIRTVDPTRIFSHQENKDLLTLMLLTSSYNLQENSPDNAAQTFLKNHEQSPSAPLLKRYYAALVDRSRP